MASAARIRVEPTMEAVISDMQRGFLRGRKMICNVLDVDLHSMKIAALKADHGAMVLFDFEVACPSISQEYLLNMLDALGVPPSFTQLVRALLPQLQLHHEGRGHHCTGLSHHQWCSPRLPFIPSAVRFSGGHPPSTPSEGGQR